MFEAKIEFSVNQGDVASLILQTEIEKLNNQKNLLENDYQRLEEMIRASFRDLTALLLQNLGDKVVEAKNSFKTLFGGEATIEPFWSLFTPMHVSMSADQLLAADKAWLDDVIFGHWGRDHKTYASVVRSTIEPGAQVQLPWPISRKGTFQTRDFIPVKVTACLNKESLEVIQRIEDTQAAATTKSFEIAELVKIIQNPAALRTKIQARVTEAVLGSNDRMVIQQILNKLNQPLMLEMAE